MTRRHNNPQRDRHGRLALAVALLACLATASLVAASAPAKARSPGNRATGLQHDLDALVASGVPGAIVFIRDGRRVTRLAAQLKA